jgi:MATE family multidrug resistance protein
MELNMALPLENAIATTRMPATAGGLREVVTLALPVILTNMSATIMMATDAAMVGRLGATELGAVGYAGIWYWTALSLFSGAATGVQTFVSQAHGSGEARSCGGWSWQGLYAVVPLAAVGITLFALAFGPLLSVLSPAPGLAPLAAAYVHMRAFGVIGITAAMVLSAFFRGFGNTRIPLYAMVIADLVNVVLNYGLIFGHFGLPAWGVAGSGMATAIAEWIYALILFVAFRRRAVDERFATAVVAPDLKAIRRFLRTSAPIGGQWLLDMLAFASFSTLVARMGTAQMAASQALLSLMHLSFMQVVGIAIAVSTLVGRYIGAGDYDAAERSHDTAMRLAISLSVAVGVIFLAVPQHCLRIFTDDADVLSLGVPLLAVGALFQVADAVGVLSGGALRGAGDTRWPFFVQTALAWGLFLPAGYLGGIVLDGGLTGAWLGGVLYVAVLGVALRWRFRSGAWRHVKI